MTNPADASPHEEKVFIRFDIYHRIIHLVFLISFSTLGLTGLVQKYSQSPISNGLINLMGGIESTRMIHHVAAVIMIAVSIVHVVDVLYRVMVLRVPLSMLPVIEDFKHLYIDVMYFLGRRKHRAYYGRYNYGEKVEYLAVVWGTVVMAITGFMMWNPIVSTRFLPGELIPAAKAAHGAEAVLAVVAIIIWHFYNVHIKHLNKSIFTGKMTEEEMAEEHPAELEELKNNPPKEIPPETLKKRKRVFIPVAVVFTLVFSVGLYLFMTIETTAITTLPPGESAEVFVPLTPTPQVTPTLELTPTPGGVAAVNTWDGTFGSLFRNRCSTCHYTTMVGGLSLATYEGALDGGKSGPGIVPGFPEASKIVEIQSAGGHPGQLTEAELVNLIEWIEAGAPEK